MVPAPARSPTAKPRPAAAGTFGTFYEHHSSPPHLMKSRPTPEVVTTARMPRRTLDLMVDYKRSPATASGTRPTSARYIHGEGHSKGASGNSLSSEKIHLNPRRGIEWDVLFCRRRIHKSIHEGLPRPARATRAPPLNPWHLHIACLVSRLSGLPLSIFPRSSSCLVYARASPRTRASRRTRWSVAHLTCPGPPRSS